MEIVNGGEPLILGGAVSGKDAFFSLDWLKENFGGEKLTNTPRNVSSFVDEVGWTVGKYIEHMNQQPLYRKKNLYGKDIPCPSEWEKSVGEIFSDYWYFFFCAFLWQVDCRRCLGKRDLMVELPEKMRPETLMIYVGHEFNLTPAHCDISGTLGNNIMVWGEEGACSYWFMCEAKYRKECDRFWKRESGMLIGNDNTFLRPDVRFSLFVVFTFLFRFWQKQIFQFTWSSKCQAILC